MDGLRLRIPTGNGQHHEVDIPPTGVVIIGRSPDCDIVLSWVLVSRRHCRIQREGKRYVVLDLNSRNGTYINGKRVKRCVLQYGDLLSFGSPCIPQPIEPVPRKSLMARARELLRQSASPDADDTIGVICSHCGHQFSVQREQLRRAFPCAQCGKTITTYMDTSQHNPVQSQKHDPDRTDILPAVTLSHPWIIKHPVLSQVLFGLVFLVVTLYIAFSVRDFIMTSHRHRQIQEHIDAGEAAERQKDYGDAIQHYRSALDMADETDAEDRKIGAALRDAQKRIDRLHDKQPIQ